MHLVLVLCFLYAVSADMILLKTICNTNDEGDAPAYKTAGLLGNYVITGSPTAPPGTFAQLETMVPRSVIQAWNCSGSECVGQGLFCDPTHASCAQPTDFKSTITSGIPQDNSSPYGLYDITFGAGRTIVSRQTKGMTLPGGGVCVANSFSVLQVGTSGYIEPTRPDTGTVFRTGGLGINCPSTTVSTPLTVPSFDGSTWSAAAPARVWDTVSTGTAVVSLYGMETFFTTVARPSYYSHLIRVYKLNARGVAIQPTITNRGPTTARASFFLIYPDGTFGGLVTADYYNPLWSFAISFPSLAVPTSADLPGTNWQPASLVYNDLFLFNDSTGTVPRRDSFSFASTVKCLAVGRPTGEAGPFQYGSVTVYCTSGSEWVVRIPRFTVTGASGFGTAVKFARSDSILAVSAPASGKVYLFAFDPLSRTMFTTPSETYSASSTIGFGTQLDINDRLLVVTAPASTTCGGLSSTSGTVFVYSVAQDCAVSSWVPTSSCSVTCGNGTQSAYRNITTQPAWGGAACPALVDTIPCSNGPCPEDCVVWILDTATDCLLTVTAVVLFVTIVDWFTGLRLIAGIMWLRFRHRYSYSRLLEIAQGLRRRHPYTRLMDFD